MEELNLYRQQLLERLESEVNELQFAYAAISTEAWHKPINAEGQTHHQLLAQLRALEKQAFFPGLMSILYEECPQLPTFDDSGWVQTQYDPHEPPEAILAEYARLRTSELVILRDLPREGWNRMGNHSQLGKRTLQWWVEYCLLVAGDHMRQLKLTRERERP